MTDAMKNKLKGLTKDIFDHVAQLEATVKYLTEGLSKLLEEDDIKGLPTYKLIHGMYSEYLTSKPPQKTDKAMQEELYDPLYAPPKTRKRANNKAKKELAESRFKAPVKATVPAPAPASASASVPVGGSSSKPSYMPDFSESLLEGMGKPGARTPAPVPVQAAARILPIKVPTDDTVYTVEINGNQYLRYGKYLYDKESQMRVGSIENGVFVIGTETVAKFNDIDDTHTVSLVPDTSYYKDKDGKLYIRLTEEGDIYQAVGELTPEGDIGLWQ